MNELGFNCAVLGLDTLMHAAKAVETVLLDMKSGKFARRNDGMDFEEYKARRRLRQMAERGRAVSRLARMTHAGRHWPGSRAAIRVRGATRTDDMDARHMSPG